MFFSELQHAVTFAPGRLEHLDRTMAGVDADRRDGQPFVLAGRRAIGGAAVIADDPQHGVAVGDKTRKGPVFRGDLGRGGIGRRVH